MGGRRGAGKGGGQGTKRRERSKSEAGVEEKGCACDRGKKQLQEEAKIEIRQECKEREGEEGKK